MFAGSPIKRIGVKRMIRNCLIAAGNSGDPALTAAIEPHLGDPDPVDCRSRALGARSKRPRRPDIGQNDDAGCLIVVAA